MQTYGTRLLTLLLLAASCSVAAQDSEDESKAAEIDEMEPAVSSSELSGVIDVERETLAPDVMRRTNSSGVMDEMNLGRTEITGNQELPKVLYIVPWKSSDPGDLMGRPVNTLLDEVLAPIDRSEFIRQVDYYADLYGEKEEQD